MFQPPPPPPQQQQQGQVSMFSSSAQSGSFLPPTPPRAAYSSSSSQLQAAQSLGRMGSFTGFNNDDNSSNIMGYQEQSAYSGNSSAVGVPYMQGSAVHTSPSQVTSQYAAADLLYGSSALSNQQQSRYPGAASTTAHAVPGMQQYQQHDASMMAAVAAAAAGLPPSYQSSPLPRAVTMTEQQVFQQQQQQLARSLSLDVGGYGMYGGNPAAAAAWGSRVGDLTAPDQGRLFGAVYDMKSLTAALSHVQAGTGEVRRMLASCTFRPRLPGLTKLVSQLSREGNWAKALEVYESLDAVGVRPDTTITNAAISACDKGAQWEKALQVFRSMSDMGLERDAITYSALISALSKGRQWCLAIDVFNHMVAEGVECDAVTCCSLITALDKGGQWQLAEQVFIQMFQGHTQFHVLLEGMQQDTTATSSTTTDSSSGSSRDKPLGSSPSSLLAGTFSVAALNALSIPEDALPPPDQLIRLSGPPGLTGPEGGTSGDTGATASATRSGKPRASGLRNGAADQGIRNGALQAGGCVVSNGASKRQAGSSSSSRVGGQHNAPPAAAAAVSVMHWEKTAADTLPGSSLKGPDGRMHDCQDSSGCCQGEQQSGPSSSSGSSSVRTDQAALGSTDNPDTAAAGAAGSSAFISDNSQQQQQQQSSSNVVRTLSGAWSKVVGANRASKDADSSKMHDSSSSKGNALISSSIVDDQWTGSGDSVLSAADAFVLTSDAKEVALCPEGTTAANAQQQQQGSSGALHTSPNSVLTRSLSAQLADVGLLPSSNAAAIKDDDEPAPAATKVPASPFSTAFKAAAAVPVSATPSTAASPARPPMHPPTRAATPLAAFPSHAAAAAMDGSGSSSTTASPLLRQPSAGLLSSPSGNIGLRFGRAGSLNSKKSSPNRVCCNALLAAYARAVPPRWKQALKLLEVMWQCGGELVPDIVSYNTVMKACGNAQQTDIAFQLYHHMQQRGIDPTVATYGTLITIASESQDYGKVKESWGWLQASGLPVHITCVNSYLTALIKEDNWDAAVDLFNQLKGNHLGVRANNVTYNILMSACLARDKPQTVKALFEEMTNSNLSPTLISFNTLLHAYAKLGAWQESLALISHLCSSAVRPSSASFNTVFCTLGNVAATVGDFDKHTICSRALDLYALMLSQPGIHLDATLYRNMVSTFTACNAPQMVLQITLAMIQQGHTLDPATAATALEALQQEGAWQAAGPLLKSCFAAGAVVSHVVIQRVLLACAGGSFWQAAREVLQVTAASNQLDNIAQVLQQYRSEYQTQSSSPALINPDSLDELLFLTFLQAQYSSGGWTQGLDLFKQLRSDRGLVFAAGNAAVYGALLELLVVRGGAEGMVAAIRIVDECHATGTMSHYLLHLGSNSSTITASAGCSSPPTDKQTAVSSGLLSPEQQLILQLEQAAITSSPQSAVCSSLLAPGSFGMSMVGGSNAAGISGLTMEMLTGLAATNSGAGLLRPLSFLDVRGCSAIEAVVLLLSFLGQVVQARVSGIPIDCEYITILTGGVGAASQGEMSQVVVYKPVTAAAASSAGSAHTTAGKDQGIGNTMSDTHEVNSGDVRGIGSPTAESSATTAAPATSSVSDTVPTPADAVVGIPYASSPSASTALSAAPLSTEHSAASSGSVDAAPSWETPCSNISPHIAALAVLNGRLSNIMGCKSSMELLVPFSAAGKLALGLLCCSALPILLPDEAQGGGICLPAVDLMQAVASAIDASRA